jgi:hypothetical protein
MTAMMYLNKKAENNGMHFLLASCCNLEYVSFSWIKHDIQSSFRFTRWLLLKSDFRYSSMRFFSSGNYPLCTACTENDCRITQKIFQLVIFLDKPIQGVRMKHIAFFRTPFFMAKIVSENGPAC